MALGCLLLTLCAVRLHVVSLKTRLKLNGTGRTSAVVALQSSLQRCLRCWAAVVVNVDVHSATRCTEVFGQWTEQVNRRKNDACSAHFGEGNLDNLNSEPWCDDSSQQTNTTNDEFPHACLVHTLTTRVSLVRRHVRLWARWSSHGHRDTVCHRRTNVATM